MTAAVSLASDEMRSPHAGVDTFLLEGKDPSAIALRFLSGNRSYGDLALAVTRVADYLLSLGCRKGERVLLIGENSFFWVASYIGAMRAGLVCVPQPTDVSPQELRDLSNFTGAVVAFVDAKLCKSHLSTLPIQDLQRLLCWKN